MHSIFQGSLVSVLAQGVASLLYLLPTKKYQNTPNIKMPVSHQFHLLVGREQLHPCNSKQTKITLSSFKSGSSTWYKSRRKGSLMAFLFFIVDFTNAFRILCPFRSRCQRREPIPCLRQESNGMDAMKNCNSFCRKYSPSHGTDLLDQMTLRNTETVQSAR